MFTFFSCSKRAAPNRSAIQPITPTSSCGFFFLSSVNPCTRPLTRCSAFSLTEHVFTRITSAFSRSSVRANPAFSKMAATTSLSATFIWQPYVSI